jgi:hypothetical protein
MKRVVVVLVAAAVAWAAALMVQPSGAPAAPRDDAAAVRSTASQAVLATPAVVGSRVLEWRAAPVPVLPDGFAGPIGLGAVALVVVSVLAGSRCRSRRTGFARRAPPVGSVSLVSL